MDWEELRGIRDGKLGMMDKYQLAIPYQLLTEAQRAELGVYRKILLDLPQDYETPEEALANLPEVPVWFH